MTALLNLASESGRKSVSGPALRTFFRIAHDWGLSPGEQMTLLRVGAKSTFYKWNRLRQRPPRRRTVRRALQAPRPLELPAGTPPVLRVGWGPRHCRV